jgi:hypothetical protein
MGYIYIPADTILFTNFKDVKSLAIYFAAFFLIIPMLKLLLQSTVSYLGYLMLRLQTVVPFRKIIWLQFLTLIIEEAVKSLFGFSHLFTFPLQLQPAFRNEVWSIRFSHLSDPFGLINWGHIIHIPSYWIMLNIAINLIPITFLFILTKTYVGLSDRKRCIFWMILSLTSLSIVYKI